MKGWYFAHKGNRLNYGDNRLIRVGITHTIDCKPRLCRSGLHGSKRIIDALSYADYHILYRVDIKGDIDEGKNKFCGRSREYLKRFDIKDILFEFSRKAAKRQFHLAKPYMSKADYSLVIKWLDTGDKSLRAAAGAAAGAAAWDAAWAAAGAVAWAAAREAAEDAAGAAAGAVAGAAWDAERNWQERTLREMIKSKYGEIL